MTLIEAINSGKPFRRPGWGWCDPTASDSFHVYDIMCLDWEVKGETKVQRFEAWVFADGRLIHHEANKKFHAADARSVRRVPQLDLEVKE